MRRIAAACAADPCNEEDGSMIAWCFIHCCWEEWRQVIK
jgi:hypothetical protein